MNAKERNRRRRSILAVAIILSIVLYGAGLLSGLYVSKTSEERQKSGFNIIEQKQQADKDFLVDYVKNLENDLQTFQIQERFIQSLDTDKACEFSELYFAQTASNLNYYWSVLPARLEEYERGRDLDSEYLEIKTRYTAASLRAWLISRNNYNQCHADIVPVLYFYNAACEDCVRQGEELDRVKAILASEGGANGTGNNTTVIAFTIDADAEDQSLALIKQYYGVYETPALIINEKAHQGQVFMAEDIIDFIETPPVGIATPPLTLTNTTLPIPINASVNGSQNSSRNGSGSASSQASAGGIR